VPVPVYPCTMPPYSRRAHTSEARRIDDVSAARVVVVTTVWFAALCDDCAGAAAEHAVRLPHRGTQLSRPVGVEPALHLCNYRPQAIKMPLDSTPASCHLKQAGLQARALLSRHGGL
jgi:hypothetical protein